MKFYLYPCPMNAPLETHITHPQCEANRKRAAKAARLSPRPCGGVGTGGPVSIARVGSECLIWLRPCLDCPGVRELARRNGERPRILEAPARAQPASVLQIPSRLLGRRMDMSLRAKRRERDCIDNNPNYALERTVKT